MPFLQYLTGSRDQQFDALNDAASLTLGSGAEAHLKVGDPGVEAKHCKVYPAQGAFWLQDLDTGMTVLNMKRMKATTERLAPGDVFIVGRTLVKFWKDKPAASGGGGGGGADPAVLQAAQQENARLKAALQQLKAGADGGNERATALEGQLAQAKQALETAQSEGAAQAKAAEEARTELADRQSAVERLEGQLEERRQELETARAESADHQQALEGVRNELSAKEQALIDTETAKQQAEARIAELEGELSAAEEEVQAAQREGEAQVEAARAQATEERAELDEALAASRAALTALRAERTAQDRDRLAALREPSDLAAAIEALALPDALRLRLEAAVETEVDRELLRRSAGPVLPIRGLRAPGSDRDLEAELGALRRRQEQVGVARDLELGALDEAALERLLEMARS